MVLVKEYRIPMPISVEEYQIAQLYLVSKSSKQYSGHGEGVQVLENVPFDDENGKGQYTHKILHIGSRLPSWVKSICPTSALQIVEKAWNAYPYCKTVYSCPFLGDRFNITIETRYLPDGGDTENALRLAPQQISQRTVELLDIAMDEIDPSKYKEEEDPAIFVSKKTGRGKLQKGWNKTHDPVMTSYKHCSVEFRYWGFQSRVESFIHRIGLRDILLLGHRQVFCWIDEWFGLTMEDIRRIEEETKRELDMMIAEGNGEQGEEEEKEDYK